MENKEIHYSLRFKEILAKPPVYLIRLGTSFIAIFILILLIGTHLISYNDIISSSILITSDNPPISLKAKTTSKIAKIFVESNQRVKKNDFLAVVDNTADHRDIYYLKDKISDFEYNMISIDSMRQLFPSNLNLGDIQIAYGNFISKYQGFILFNNLVPNERESELIEKKINELHKLQNKQKEVLIGFEKSLELSIKSYNRIEKIYNKGVVSLDEYEEASRKIQNERNGFEEYKNDLLNTKISITNARNQLINSDIKGEEMSNMNIQQLEEAVQNLKKEILDWENNYMFISPIEGKVTVFGIWKQFQNINSGEVVFAVVPEKIHEIIGVVKLPIENSGKVRIGQKVIIKLQNFPYHEWGSIKGEVSYISNIPNQGSDTFYTLYVSIKDLTTSFNKTIEFRQEMYGNVEIILEELTVLEKILYSLRQV